MTDHVSAVPARVSDAAIGRVLDDLLLAGGSPDQLAAWLSNLGCVGYPTDPHCCPIAQYFRRRLPLSKVYVRTETVVLTLTDGRVVDLMLDMQLQVFVDLYDHRRWPELIAGQGIRVPGATYADPPADE